MRVYLSGPMTGLPDNNAPAFAFAATNLRARGYDVISPPELDGECEMAWIDCIARDLPLVAMCDAIVVLPGWQHSPGALLEIYTAELLGIPVLRYGHTYPLLPVPGNYTDHAHLHRRQTCHRPSSRTTRTTSRQATRLTCLATSSTSSS